MLRALALLTILLVAGCSSVSVVGETPRSITLALSGGVEREATEIAKEHCLKYGKYAQEAYRSEGSTRITYHCVD